MAEQAQVQIPRVKLGAQGLEVSKLGFGCMGLTGVYNAPVSDEVGIAIIKHAFHNGITFFDTSDIYGPRTNEILLGKALKQLPREKIQIATKFGISLSSSATGAVINGKPEYLRACCEESLERLGVEYIDLYYQHRVDKTVPIEETMGELKKLVEEGKVKYIGLSEASPNTIRRAHAVHPITALQMEWSLWTRDIEPEIVPLCSIRCISEFLYSEIRNIILLNLIDTFFSLLSGTTKLKNLDSNIGSLKVRLTKEDLKELTDAVPEEEVLGYRSYSIGESINWHCADTPPLHKNPSA
ncbi:hypothetical protein ZIOFF_001784 [Zingiber officinale]|uniref:NADP-dependent oxidoreductase domain-containing protein n=1 Tax=Zingiber officinale TaxID=94328 RepID=A0A8J5M8W9_ZINOF|nr:hypothetical protein ZIOFF_001784 [Zingiber officinale]